MLSLVTMFFASAAGGQSLPEFVDVTEQAGIHFKHSFGDEYLSNIVEGTGSGLMFFDYNNDGWMDIYFVNGAWTNGVSSNQGRHLRGKLRDALYRNNGDGTFTDVTDEAGVGDLHFGTGCSAADYDNDGFVDIYVLNYGPNVLYHNNGDGTFTDVSRQAGLDDPRWSLSAPWFDYNGDGLLDVYVCNYLEYDLGAFRAYYKADGYPGPLSYKGQPDALYRNNGDGTFTEVTKEAGLWNPEGRGMSATVADVNNDGLLDIYVTNDAMANDFFLNLGGGKFRNEALPMGLAFGEGGQGVSSMGPDFGDIDHDGLLDLFIPDMDFSCLLMNRGEYFEDWTARAKIAAVCGQYTGWGSIFLDYDNDGWLDIVVANGDAHHEYPEEDVLLRNNGDGTFTDVSHSAGSYFRLKRVGRALACGDFDNDGDLDVLVGNLNDRPVLLRNDGGNRNNWLMVWPKRSNGRSDAIGARVKIHAGGVTQFRDMIPVRGYLSQMDPRLHFGLGQAKIVDWVEISWPGGKKTLLENVNVNQVLKVVEPQ